MDCKIYISCDYFDLDKAKLLKQHLVDNFIHLNIEIRRFDGVDDPKLKPQDVKAIRACDFFIMILTRHSRSQEDEMKASLISEYAEAVNYGKRRIFLFAENPDAFSERFLEKMSEKSYYSNRIDPLENQPGLNFKALRDFLKDAGCMMANRQKRVHVFISYAREDREIAEKIYQDLKAANIQCWIDAQDLPPGANWKAAIKKAIRNSSYFIAILSSNSVSKTGYVQKELKIALEMLDEFPESKIFIIPVRIDDCEPDNERLSEINWLDIFSSYPMGIEKLLNVVRPEEHEEGH